MACFTNALLPSHLDNTFFFFHSTTGCTYLIGNNTAFAIVMFSCTLECTSNSEVVHTYATCIYSCFLIHCLPTVGLITAGGTKFQYFKRFCYLLSIYCHLLSSPLIYPTLSIIVIIKLHFISHMLSSCGLYCFGKQLYKASFN